MTPPTPEKLQHLVGRLVLLDGEVRPEGECSAALIEEVKPSNYWPSNTVIVVRYANGRIDERLLFQISNGPRLFHTFWGGQPEIPWED